MVKFELLWLVFIYLFSPGPNVILLTSSGARFGARATLPHLLGVVIGVGVIGFVVGLGVGVILTGLPWLDVVLRLVAMLWILALAYQLWCAAAPAALAHQPRPMGLLEAILFQWVNPKVWAVAIAASALLVDLPVLHQGVVLGAVMSGINLFVCVFWTSFGHLLGQLLLGGAPRQRFLRVMAILLGASALLVLIEV